MRVPSVGGLEGDRARRQTQRIERVLVDLRMGLEDADRVGRQKGVEQVFPTLERLTSAPSISGEPLERMAVLKPRSRRELEDRGNPAKRLEAEIELH